MGAATDNAAKISDLADAGVLRLLDANLNRAREGLRVVEDTARFVWNDEPMYRRVRALRHKLHELTAASYKKLVSARDSDGDAGRRLKESGRTSLSGVVSANVRRAEEAVRVLEEYSKVFSPKTAAGFKAVRFAVYEEEKRILKRL